MGGLLFIIAWIAGFQSPALAASSDTTAEHGAPPAEAQVTAPAVPPDLVLTQVNVVPMDSPRVIRDQVVLIRDGLIQAMGSADEVEIPVDAEVVRGQGRYLLPGLTDAHVHLDEGLGSRPDFGDAPLFFAAGITSVLNLRGDQVSLDWRRRIEAGELIAPTLYSSGEFINEPLVTSPEEVAQEIRRQAQAGFDVVKFHEYYSQNQRTTVGLSRETYDRMVAAAEEIGIPLVGHTPHNLGLAAVVEEGQSLAHLNCLLEYDLLPDPTARFQAYARTTKWSCLALLALAAGTLAWGATRLRWARLATVFSAVGLVLGSLFLYLWEHLFWAGNDFLIFSLFLLALALLGLTVTLFATMLRRGTSRALRALLAFLSLPLVVLLFSLSYWLPLAWRTTEGELEELAAVLKEREISVITTLILDSGLTPDQFEPWYRYLSEEAAWVSKPYAFEKPRFWQPSLDVARWTPLLKTVAKKLQEADVPLIAGTDAGGFPLMVGGVTLHRELELLVEAGLTPYQALRTATAAPAIFLGREGEFGTIAPGKRADLLLVDGNPLEGLATLSNPQGLSVRGRWLSAQRLALLLATLEAPSSPE